MLKRQSAYKIGACILFWALSAGVIAMMFDFSGQSGAESQSLSVGLTQWILDHFSFVRMDADKLEHLLRKIAHFCMFAAEGFFLHAALRFSMEKKGLALIAAAAVSALLAVINELHQLFSAERSCQASDMLLDFGGGICGMAAFALIALILRRIRRK